MRVLFLDFDGVLNSWPFFRTRKEGTSELDPKAVALLNKLDAEIVVSSSWRLGRTRTQLCDILTAAGCVLRVIGKTPDRVSRPSASGLYVPECRSSEIEAWLTENAQRLKVEAFAIVDDDVDAGVGYEARFVKTDFATGLMKEHVEQIAAILKTPCAEMKRDAAAVLRSRWGGAA